jgi:hypothetical protein
MTGQSCRAPIAVTFFTAMALAGLALASSPISAEVAQRDGVRVSVTGKMTPTRLPRRASVPVAVSVASHITAMAASVVPKLEMIRIAINSHGKLENRGIPLCRLGRIKPSTTTEALTACRQSLIGEGRFSANVRLPEQSPFPSEGRVLAFNGRLRGEPAIFAHIYGIEPVPTSYVLPFLISGSTGTYGSILEASLPSVTGEWGYVTGVRLNFQSRFLAAACPAPPRFAGAVFPLMKTTFGFASGLNLSSTLTRSCRVRS